MYRGERENDGSTCHTETVARLFDLCGHAPRTFATQTKFTPSTRWESYEVDGELWVRGGGQVKISKSNTALTASTPLGTQRTPPSYRNPS